MCVHVKLGQESSNKLEIEDKKRNISTNFTKKTEIGLVMLGYSVTEKKNSLTSDKCMTAIPT